MDINQIITNMKTTDLFQPILLFALFLCGLTACNDSDEIRLSPFQETTVKGEASTLQIDLTRGDWRITSITTPWGDLMMDGNKLPQLKVREACIINGGTWNGTPTAISSCTLKTTLT